MRTGTANEIRAPSNDLIVSGIVSRFLKLTDSILRPSDAVSVNYGHYIALYFGGAG